MLFLENPSPFDGKKVTWLFFTYLGIFLVSIGNMSFTIPTEINDLAVKNALNGE